MNKTFKKAIAVILSVLMVVLSVPFTALAAPGDYEPNLKMYFGTFVEDNATNYTDYSTCGTGSEKFGSYASLYGAPVDYNYTVVNGNTTSGTLTISKDKANTFNSAIENYFPTLENDVQLGVGDYFTMTVAVENIKVLSSILAQVQFSDSIEPAGIYSYKSGRKNVYKLGTETERAAAKGTWEKGKGGLSYLPLYSLCEEGVSKSSFTTDGSNSSQIIANSEDGKYNVLDYSWSWPNVDTTSVADPDGLFVDPTTGEASGYTYTNAIPVATFVFKIVTNDPIQFHIYNPTNVKSFSYVGPNSDGTMIPKLTTYAKNAWDTKTNTNTGDTEWPGSKKSTFMGFNEFKEAPKPSTYTIKFKYANGGEEVSKTVNAGEMPTAPETNTPQTVKSDNAGNHTVTTYTWPTVEAATADRVYEEVANPVSSACSYERKVTLEPTYTTEGEATYTCTVCKHSYTEKLDKLVCDHKDTKVVNATKPTINKAGYTGDTVCNVCGETIATGTVIAQLNGEAYRAALKAAQSKNAKDYTAESFAKVTEALAKYDEATVGAYTSQEDVDAATAALKDAVAKLDAGVVVTVASTKLGTTTLNGADATNGANARLAVGDDVTLTAKANTETGEFVGWKVGTKIVSTDETYKTVATANITYEAVFAEKVDETFTVVFVDPYGNVISTQPVTSGADIKVPTAPTLIGYTFTGWSMNEEEISKLTDGATIYAQYKKDDVAKYTVTAPEGATLTVDGVETASPATVAYDAKVSVHKDGVAAWQVDGVTVAYGDTYTFFCGSDMNLVAVDNVVEQKTTVVITGVNEIAGSVQVSFAASRNVAPGETVVKQGFIYGKNLADSELTLDNVGNKGADANAGTVKIAYTKNSAADISLRYGLSKKDGKVSAAAFVITKTADGTLKKAISEVKSYTYH